MGLAPFDIDDHLFSDVRVVFSIKVTNEDGGHDMVAKQDANLSFLAHKELEIPIEEEELLAAKVLIHHMYTGEFNKEMDKKPPIDGLLIKCGKELLIKFPDVTALCKSCLEEVGPFPRLTFHAMLALISSDQIRADSENDVLVLACIWVRHNTPSQEQLSLLSQKIRLKHLTPSFLVNLKLIAPWFAATPRALIQVLALQGYAMDMQQAQHTQPVAAVIAVPEDSLEAPHSLLPC
eukprot:gene30358-35363_t